MQNSHNNLRVVACPHPFKVANKEYSFAPTISVAQVLREVQPDPILRRYAHVWVNNKKLSPDKWETTFPKKGSSIDIRVVPHGSGVGRMIGTIFIAIAAIAIMIAMPYLLPAGFTLFGLSAGATAGLLGGVAALAVGVVGNLVLNALCPPVSPTSGALPSLGLSTNPGSLDYGTTSNTLSISGASNKENKYGPIPKYYGRHRTSPPYGATTYTESLGNEQYLHLLFVWGYGPIELEDLRIGQTPIANFDGVDMLHANLTYNGTTYGETSLKDLYPVTIQEEALAKLLSYNTEVTSTTEIGIDQISVDVTCPNGLMGLSSDGSTYDYTIAFTVTYRETGTSGAWLTPSGVDSQNNSVTAISMTGNSKSSVRESLKWSVSNGQYDVKIKRTTSNDDIWHQSVSYWTSIRSITNEDPIQGFPTTLAKTAMRIKASGQLNGTVDEFNAIVNSFNPDFRREIATYEIGSNPGTGYSEDDVLTLNQSGVTTQATFSVDSVGGSGEVTGITIVSNGYGHSVEDSIATTVSPTGGSGCTIDILTLNDWVAGKTKNPASHFVEVLQGSQNAKPLADGRIDWDNIEAWHIDCETNGYEYNKVIDYQENVKGLLDEIAASGRASFTWIDSKAGVFMDRVQSYTKGPAFTPRNILKDSFSSTIVYPDLPHAFRVQFPNENVDWQQDERVVLDDGYAIDGKDAWGASHPEYPEASLFELLDLPGVTNPDLIFVHARYHIATARLRPETIQFSTDIEWMVATRGDRIKFAHDVMLTGLSWGRVTELQYDMGGYISGVSLDEEMSMEAGKSYVLRFRLSDNTSLLVPIVTSPSELSEADEDGNQYMINAHTVVFDTPINPSTDPYPVVGDLVLFGESGEEAIDLLIKSVQPNSDLTAMITCVEYNEAIYTADQGTIPEHDSHITTPVDWSIPIVSWVRSDGTVLIRDTDGSWKSRILLTLTTPSGLDSSITGVECRYWPTNSIGVVTVLPVARLDDGEVSITPVEDDLEYSYQLRYVKKNGNRGTWTTVATHTVEGKTAPPSNVTGFIIMQIEGIITSIWTAVPDLDLAGYEIRYGDIDCVWDESAVVNGTYNGTTFSTTNIPPGSWDVLIKAKDTSGNYSTTEARKTFQVFQFYSILSQIDHYPLWSGILTNFIRNPLTGYLNPDDQDIPDGDDFDVFDNYVVNPYTTMSYEAPEIDLGSDQVVRLWGRVYGNLGPGETGSISPQLSIDYKLDGGAYDGFENWNIGYIEARYIKSKVTVTSSVGLLRLTNVQITADQSV